VDQPTASAKSSLIFRPELLQVLDTHRSNNESEGDYAVIRLAAQVRFRSSTGSYAPTDEEVLGVMAIPNCIVNKWIEDHIPPPQMNIDPTYLQACPSA
jgi:hypothetical protein